MERLVLLAFSLVAIIQLIYWVSFRFFLGKILIRDDKPRELLPTASLIVAARNEAENLRKYLPLWLDQLKKDDELLVVDDRSTDQTPEILLDLSTNYSQLRIVTISDSGQVENYGKKHAISQAIEVASHELLLFTDADCFPADSHWVNRMKAGLQNDQLVLGAGFLAKSKGFTPWLSSFDTIHTAILYFSFAKAGIPYMGVGRSMAYRKDLFKRNQGFESHVHIKSGDDDLFVSSMKNVSTYSDPSAMTYSNPKSNISEYFYQRIRHSSTSFHYQTIHKILLGLYYLTLAIYWPLALCALVFGYFEIVIALTVIRLILLASSHKKMKKLTRSSFLPWQAILADFILPWLYPLFTLGALLTNSIQWKD